MITIHRNIEKKRVFFEIDTILKEHCLNSNINANLPVVNTTIECILQPHPGVSIEERIKKVIETNINTNGILFISDHTLEEDTYSVKFYKISDNAVLNSVKSDGAFLYEKEHNLNNNFVEIITGLIESFDKNTIFPELEQINLVLKSIFKIYKKTGFLSREDIEWMEKIYKEYNI